ncbi:methyltransferase N6AMT1-like isoform X4 [Lineus longissimus]|uniref:methyltransferase N6AMT1-like isoform X4 n=1 Tax=Lineus longissimus TaxID=88925 RepID=UPI00315DEC61
MVVLRYVSICLEVGCGSGVAITFLGQIIGSKALYLCTDINPMAAKASKETGKRNCVKVNPVITDLVSCLEDRLMGNVDVLLFNPPYVVTPSEEVGSHGIEASWAGGDRGRQVSDRLFPIIGNLLAPGGAFYLVIVKENNEDEIISMMKAQGLVGSAVLRRRAGPEHLSILKFNKPG